jgi:hypothetical protein
MNPNLIHLIWFIVKVEIEGVKGVHDMHIVAWDAVKQGNKHI